MGNYYQYQQPNYLNSGSGSSAYSMFGEAAPYMGGIDYSLQNPFQMGSGVNPNSFTPSQYPLYPQGGNVPNTTTGKVSMLGAPTNAAPQGFFDKLGNFFSNPIGKTQEYMNGGQVGDGYLRDTNGALMLDANNKPMVDPNFITRGDIWSGIGATAQTALGAYGMFADIGHKKDLIQNQRNELQLARDQFNEQLRHRNAVRSQNRGA